MFKKIGFVGGGRIVKIILEGLKNKNFNLESIYVYDCNSETLDNLKKAFPFLNTVDSISRLNGSDLIILAVHPPVMNETLLAIKPLLNEKTIILSLAPKITIAQMNERLGGFGRIVRCNPNATSIINEGYNPVSFSSELTKEDKKAIFSLLEKLGYSWEVDEAKLEAYAVVSAMAPTYFWFIWDELLKLGVNFGLKEDEAKDVIEKVIPAAVYLYIKYGMDGYNLIFARPLKDDEENIRNIFKTKLTNVFEKLKN
ncbi:MAG: pyrroline-5-carboxylate reductase family protein [Brevinematia bacterium]